RSRPTPNAKKGGQAEGGRGESLPSQVCLPLNGRSTSVRLQWGRSKGLLEILAFLAALRTQFFQHRKLFSRLRLIASLDIELAQVFASALVIGIEIECFFVIGQR